MMLPLQPAQHSHRQTDRHNIAFTQKTSFKKLLYKSINIGKNMDMLLPVQGKKHYHRQTKNCLFLTVRGSYKRCLFVRLLSQPAS
jgi:hypothetical protein